MARQVNKGTLRTQCISNNRKVPGVQNVQKSSHVSFRIEEALSIAYSWLTYEQRLFMIQN